MAIELATKYLPYVDEVFTQESKKSLLTNNNFSFDGADTVKIYKISTSQMNDYGRKGATGGNWSRYGAVDDLDATTQTMHLENDRSFTFVIDKLDSMDTGKTLAAASALARQIREVVIPEVDCLVYSRMAQYAGTKPTALALTKDNIYDQILLASKALDDAMVPETDRVLLVTPDTYRIMKLNPEIIMNTEIGASERKKGVIGMLDGATVVKVPASRLPKNFGFMLAHPCATVAPTKLESYKTHTDPPGISGELVEGRIVYDAFVLSNKDLGIYYQAIPETT
ncbi:MAG: hypothetical protein ACI4D2_08620 [Lachnospiraceae bacterium]